MNFWDAIQIAGLLLSFLYLLLEFRQKQFMWVVSACCSMIYASVYFHSKIYADMAFSCFNIVMCIYGYVRWLRSGRLTASDNKESDIVYHRFTPALALKTAGCTLIIWAAIYSILHWLTDSPVPVLDALTTTLNIVGTWVLAQKLIEVWGFWFVVNLVSIYVYCSRGLHISTIMLYTFYLGASVYGFFKWKMKGTYVA